MTEIVSTEIVEILDKHEKGGEEKTLSIQDIGHLKGCLKDQPGKTKQKILSILKDVRYKNDNETIDLLHASPEEINTHVEFLCLETTSIEYLKLLLT